MTCRPAWAGEQLHDVEAGTPVATACHALGAVPWRHHPSPIGSRFNSGASLRLPQSRSRAGCPCLGEVLQPTQSPSVATCDRV
jgi:hypothetical protein